MSSTRKKTHAKLEKTQSQLAAVNHQVCAICGVLLPAIGPHYLVGSLFRSSLEKKLFKLDATHMGQAICCSHLPAHQDCSSPVCDNFDAGVSTMDNIAAGEVRLYRRQSPQKSDGLLNASSTSSTVSPEKAKHVRKRYSAAYDSESQESASTLFGTSTKSHHLSFADRKGMKRLAELQEVRAKLRQEEIVNKYLQSSLVNHKAMKADIRRKFQRYRARVSEKARLVSVEVPKCSIARQLLIKLDPVINQEWSGSLSASDHDSLQDECRHWLGISNVKHFLRELESFDAQSHAHNPKSAFSRSEWYLIWLIQARHGMTITTVSYWVGLSPKTTTDHLDRAQGVLYLWADREICLPSIDEWREITSDDYLEKYGNDLPFFIDGAHIDIYPPSNPEIQKEAFNVKLSTHSLFFTILVACNGKIVWMSECDLGNMNEVTAWNTSTGPISLHEKYRSTYLPPQKLRLNSASTPQLVISGDQAYRNLVLPRGWKARITATVGEVDALAGVGNLTSFNGNSQVSFTSEATLTQIPTIAREKLFIPGAGQSLIDRFVARWQSVVEESLENMNRWRLLQNLDLTSREVLTVEKSCKIIGALCNWNLNETRQTEDRLLSPEEALKRLKPSKLFRDVQSACTTMISPSFDSKIIDIPEAPHDRTQSASVRPKRHQQSSNELKDFLKSIEHLGFITPFFISANHDVLSVHDGDVIQGVAAGRNRGIQVEIQDDQSTHLSGWIRSTLTKQWYRTELDIRDDAVDDPECACGNPFSCAHIAQLLYTIYAYNHFGKDDERPPSLEITGLQLLSARNTAQCGLATSWDAWRTDHFKQPPMSACLDYRREEEKEDCVTKSTCKTAKQKKR